MFHRSNMVDKEQIKEQYQKITDDQKNMGVGFGYIDDNGVMWHLPYGKVVVFKLENAVVPKKRMKLIKGGKNG